MPCNDALSMVSRRRGTKSAVPKACHVRRKLRAWISKPIESPITMARAVVRTCARRRARATRVVAAAMTNGFAIYDGRFGVVAAIEVTVMPCPGQATGRVATLRRRVPLRPS